MAHPGAFTTVVCAARNEPGSVDELTRLVRDEGARGFRWFTFHGGADVVEPRVLWDALGALDVPVVVTFLDDQLETFASLVPTLGSFPIAVDHCAFADLTRGMPDELAALAAFPNVHLTAITLWPELA